MYVNIADFRLVVPTNLSRLALDAANPHLSNCSKSDSCNLRISIDVFNKLAASCPRDLSRLVSHNPDSSCGNSLLQICRSQVATSLISTNFSQLDEVNTLAATCCQFSPSREFHNLRQVGGISSCVNEKI